jgi:carbon storage regulator
MVGGRHVVENDSVIGWFGRLIWGLEMKARIAVSSPFPTIAIERILAHGGTVMLVISRKQGDSVVIDDKILVTIMKIQRDKVSLELKCPEQYSIQLEESGKQINHAENLPPRVVVRKKLESFVINSDFTVTVVEIRDDKVRLGIVVPKECSVHRKEVFDAIHGKLL